MEYEVTLTFKIDPDAWAYDYGLAADEVRDDVLSSLATNLPHLPTYIRDGGWRALDGIATITVGEPRRMDGVWTFFGHWEDSTLVIDYSVEGHATDDRPADSSQYSGGPWCDSGVGETVEEAERNTVAEYVCVECRQDKEDRDHDAVCADCRSAPSRNSP